MEPDALSAASFACAVLRRHLPEDITPQVVSFVAGSQGWHIDDVSEYGLCDLIKTIHAAQEFTAAPVCTSLAMDRAAGAGNIELVRWLHENRSEGCSQQAFYDAAKNNHLRLLQWLFVHETEGLQLKGLENGILYHSIQAGHATIVEWLCTSRPTIAPLYNVFDHACRCGHLSIVRLLHRLGQQNVSLAKCSTNAMDTAADQGHLDVVEWLHRHRPEGCTTNAMDYAASRGHFHVLKWLHSNRTEGCTRKALFNAVAKGHAEIVRWLLDAEVVSTDSTLLSQAMEFAAYHEQKTVWSMLAKANASTVPVASQRSDLYVSTQMRMTT